MIVLLAYAAGMSCAYAQKRPLNLPSNDNITPNSNNTGNNPVLNRKGKNDTSFIKARNSLADSITINFRYFDSTRVRLLDSSINDFTTRYPVPYFYNTLGNFGTAAQSLWFSPNLKPGWDAGFHSFDIYRFTSENTRFFQTTKPYTELGYLIGPNSEQMINVMHTQNRKNLNFVFEYRLINSPGELRTQNTSNNNFRVNTVYQSSNKRYTNYFIYIANNMNASENGGLRDPADLGRLALNDPFEAQTRLGSGQVITRNPFSTNVNTGTGNREKMLLMRQQYDFGQKDSVRINDSTVNRLFYPRFRLQHTLQYTSYTYNFHDRSPIDSNYQKYYQYFLPVNTTLVEFTDKWKDLSNEFSVISFPEKKNLNQYIKLGTGLQLLSGNFLGATQRYTNIYGLAEYRNRTQNKKWDVEANGKLFLAGNYVGNYSAYISLTNLVSNRIGSYQVGFQNVNRTPSAFFEGYTSFPLKTSGSLSNENLSRFFASLMIPKLKIVLRGNYYFITNYTYLTDQYTVAQQSSPFNLLQLMAEKKFRITKYINLYTEAHLQQAAGSSPVRVPLFLTRNRLAFEGNFFTNLFLSTGLELRYYTPYKANNYMPFNQQFYLQDATISNLPDTHLFLDIRIHSFKLYLRYENVNSYVRRNYVAPNYPMQARWLRYGIFWNFVN